MLRKGIVKNNETGEIILCFEAEEGVPMGREAGMSRYPPLDFEGVVLLSLMALTIIAPLFLIACCILKYFHFI